MRRALLFCAAVAFAIACGDNVTEPVPSSTPSTPPILFATSTSGDGVLSITTDKDDYSPGDMVHLTGSGWEAGEVLDIVLDDGADMHTWMVTVSDDGTFHDSTYIVDVQDLGVTFTLTATSQTDSQRTLTVVFTDGNFTFASSPAGILTSVTYDRFNGSNTCLGDPNSTDQVWTTGNIGLNTSQSIRFTVPSVTGYSFTGYSSGGATILPASSAATTVYCLSGNAPGTPLTTITLNYSLANAAPNAPSSLAQFKSDGTSSIVTGGATNETSVVLKAGVSDPDANTVKLQVEVRPIGTAFSNASTAESGLLSSPNTASVTVSSLVNGTSYHWQARTVDNSGAASAWVSYGGNTEAASDFLVDTDPPTVNCGTADANWHPTDVSIPCTATDALSGLADPTNDASFSLTTSVTAGNETANALTGSRIITDLAGNTATAGPIAGNMIDKKAPQVTLTCPASPLLLNASVTANWSATEGGSGFDGPSSGNIPVPTNSVGSHSIAVPANATKDKVGNQSLSSNNCNYSVVYDWDGFFQPVDNVGLNVAKAGSAIPVKFNLGGNQGLDIFFQPSQPPAYPNSSKVACDTYSDQDTIEETVNAGQSSLTYDAVAQQYVYVWKSDKGWAGTCRRLDVKLKDGTTHSAVFRWMK